MAKIKKINIAGFSGSGKTTLGRRIEKELGIPIVFIDKYYFAKGKKLRPYDDICKDLSEICAQDTWVIDGLNYKFAEKFIAEADLVIFINPGVFTNTKNVFKRKLKHILQTKRRADPEAVKKIHFINTKRIWTDRKGFREKWLNIIECNKEQFKVIKINKVNKRTSRQVIGQIKELNGG